MNFMNKTNPIGVFDSGIGGLTVVKRINQLLPTEKIIYLGDTARVPYGSKSNSTVIEYALQNTQFLMKKNVKLIVVACNTVSAVAMDALKKKFDIPFISMIEPGVQMALHQSNSKKIGVIGTNATINNKAYSNAIHKQFKKAIVSEKACPLFVPFAEEGWTDHKAIQLVAKDYLSDLKEEEIDTLILGCTHYPILANTIQKVVGKKVKLIDSGTAASFTVETHLTSRGLRTTTVAEAKHEFYVTDIPSKFTEIAERFLGKKLDYVEKIELDKEFLTVR